MLKLVTQGVVTNLCVVAEDGVIDVGLTWACHGNRTQYCATHGLGQKQICRIADPLYNVQRTVHSMTTSWDREQSFAIGSDA
jgi:hypothetical protein